MDSAALASHEGAEERGARPDSAPDQPRVQRLYCEQLRQIAQTVDRSFAVLMAVQYVACVAAAVWISPRTWAGAQSSIHFHVWAAIILGAIITSFPVAMALLRPGAIATRHIVATGQMLMSALLIHVTGGRLETHFHIFGSLAFLAFYRDPKVLVTASAVVGLDHLLRGIFWPQSVFGVLASSSWRWLEHVAWVIFEDVFLIISIRHSREMIRNALEHRVEVERARDEAMQANRAKDDFIAVLSHELRTPLTPSLLDLSELESDHAISGSVRERLHLIKRNVELEARLIDDLLDVTRIANGKVRLSLGTVDLHECIEHALKVAEAELREKRLRVEKRFAATNAVVVGDETRIRQVFFNLLRNAIKFTPEGGWIRAATETRGDGIHVEIEDNGIGIPESVLPQLFQRFQQGGREVTRKFGGLGLGLSICRSIMDLHRGEISASSAGEGRGAKFTLFFPTRPHHLPSAPADTQNGARPPRERADGFRVLLVDDHADTRQTLARLLRRAGHDVVTASSVGAALEQARQNEFDLLLSDIGLPDGTGHDIMTALADRAIRGIALSGFGSEEDVQRSLEAGFSAHLTKPVDFARLQSAIEEATCSNGALPTASAQKTA